MHNTNKHLLVAIFQKDKTYTDILESHNSSITEPSQYLNNNLLEYKARATKIYTVLEDFTFIPLQTLPKYVAEILIYDRTWASILNEFYMTKYLSCTLGSGKCMEIIKLKPFSYFQVLIIIFN